MACVYPRQINLSSACKPNFEESPISILHEIRCVRVDGETNLVLLIKFYDEILISITCVKFSAEIKYLHFSAGVGNDLFIEVVVCHIKQWGDVFC